MDFFSDRMEASHSHPADFLFLVPSSLLSWFSYFNFSAFCLLYRVITMVIHDSLMCPSPTQRAFFLAFSHQPVPLSPAMCYTMTFPDVPIVCFVRRQPTSSYVSLLVSFHICPSRLVSTGPLASSPCDLHISVLDYTSLTDISRRVCNSPFLNFCIVSPAAPGRNNRNI